MPWVSSDSHKDAKEALLDLASFLKEQYLIGLGTDDEPKKCCLATKAKEPEAAFCLKCAASLEDPEFDEEHFTDWLCGLDTDSDTFHGYIQWDPNAKWQTGQLEGMPNQRFVYQAERVIAAALGYPHHKDYTFATICKNRTKNKADSFTYF